MRWARENAKLDVATAASRIGRAEEEIRQWESGEKKPTFAQARKASEVYHRSLAVFYLPEPPKTFDTLRDFRHLPHGHSAEWSPELALLVRQVQARQEWLREFLIEEKMKPVEFVGMATLDTPPTDLASSIRRELRLSIQEQMACSEPRKAMNLWIERAEEAGVNICREGGIECEEARGFALADNYAPFIFVNSTDSYAGRLFTVVHELVHLWINQPGISNLGGVSGRTRSAEAAIERFCNHAAAITLVDQSLFEAHWNRRDTSERTADLVKEIARKFAVSEEVIARRLLEMGEITEQGYASLRNSYAARWEEVRKRQKAQKGGPKYGLKMALQNGFRFSRFVLSAYGQGRISGRDASALLHVKVNHLGKVEGNVFAGGLDFGRVAS
jgi:Zn-dependent peptidase ImmA (M78 family)